MGWNGGECGASEVAIDSGVVAAFPPPTAGGFRSRAAHGIVGETVTNQRRGSDAVGNGGDP